MTFIFRFFSAENECPFSFSAVNGISFSSAFSFTAENEKCFSVGLCSITHHKKGLGLEMQSLGLQIKFLVLILVLNKSLDYITATNKLTRSFLQVGRPIAVAQPTVSKH